MHQEIGRSKGGLTTKIHATCDALGNPTAFHLTPSQDHDLAGADVLMVKMIQADALLADKTYDADERMRQKLKEKGCISVIPPKSNCKNPSDHDIYAYKARHLIENFFAESKQYRAIATRYDKTSQNFLGGIYMAFMVICLN
jgi:transposase